MRHCLKLYPFLVSFPPLSWFLCSWEHFLNKFLTLVSLAQDLLLRERNSREKKKISYDFRHVVFDCVLEFSNLYCSEKRIKNILWVGLSQSIMPTPRGHTLLPKCSISCCPLLGFITFCCHLIDAAKFSQPIVDKIPENILLALGRGICSPALTPTFKSEKSTFITITVISTL